jgi:kynurenine formamidase
MRNWGRWGPEDQRGALNLVTPERLLDALRIPKVGRIYRLAQSLQMSGVPMATNGGTPIHLLTVNSGPVVAGQEPAQRSAFAEDYLTLRVHANTTHIDSLGHLWNGNEIYNGFSADTIRGVGMERCGIENVECIITRGVFLDLPRFKGVANLDGGYTISSSDLESCASRDNIEIRAGDVVLIRTGWRTVFDRDREAYHASRPGIGVEAADWLASRDVVAVGGDTMGLEVTPYAHGSSSPVHQRLLKDCGIYIIELMELEELSETGIHEFLFAAIPLNLRGGGGGGGGGG